MNFKKSTLTDQGLFFSSVRPRFLQLRRWIGADSGLLFGDAMDVLNGHLLLSDAWHIPMTDPWDWYIYLHEWLILFMVSVPLYMDIFYLNIPIVPWIRKMG